MVKAVSNRFKGIRFRYSLRALFLLTICVAAVFYWQSRAADIARRFVAQMNNGHYQTADDLFIEPRHKFLVDLMQKRGPRGVRASMRAQSWWDWICGTCEVTVVDDEPFVTNAAGNPIQEEGLIYVYEIAATARGLQEPQLHELIRGGSIGGF